MHKSSLSRRTLLSGAILIALTRQGRSQNADQLLVATRAQASLLEDQRLSTEVLRFQGPALPMGILRAKQGQVFSGRIQNQLDQELALQFFGVRAPAEAISITVPAGTVETPSEVSFRFTPPDAGTFWLGPVSKASMLRDQGLAAMFIVEEAETREDFTDIPVVLDDWMINADAKLDADFDNLERIISEGRIGNWVTVNGSFKPRLPARGGAPVRLRLLNVANARQMRVSFPGANALLLAFDGQPLTAARNLGSEPLGLSPGQRADVLVDTFDKLIPISLDLGSDAVEAAFIEPVPRGLKSTAKARFTLPANPLPRLAAEVRTQPLIIEGGAKGGLQKAVVGFETLDLRQMLERGLAWSLNGISGPGGPILFRAAKGETILLEVENKTEFEQVICIHGHVWQIVEVAGTIVDQPFSGDTAVIAPQSGAKIIFVADNPGLWLIHATVAERSDSGLMGSFSVE